VNAGSVSAVVPVFRGARTLPELVSRLATVLGGLTGRYEVILVNDGSPDESWEEIRRLAREHDEVRGIDLLHNFGQHNALLAGIRAARGDVIVTLDDDLQNPPEEIPKLLAELHGDADVIYGTPIRKGHSRPRVIASRLVVKVLNRIGGTSAPMVSSFRAFPVRLRDAFDDYRGPDVSIDGLLTWGAHRFATVDVVHEERTLGESGYDLRRLISHALTMITAFSTQPLRFAAMVGFAATIFGFGTLVYVLIRFATEGGSVPGFPFLASLISILAGAQLFAVGVIGEYLARMHVRVMRRPAYVIREEFEGGED
jgi:glycosyltransferase involved in cell wall biosynthesis